MIMGAEEGTRDMTWEEIEEEADKLRVKGGDQSGDTVHQVWGAQMVSHCIS